MTGVDFPSYETADDIRTRRALDQKPCLRGFAETSYQAKSWNTDRRACARIEASAKGLDIRFVVTSIETGSAEPSTSSNCTRRSLP